jgi:hypothetical protein
MKRCWRKGKFLPIIVLASLFLFIGCGIPTYLSLDSDITIVKHTDGTAGANITVAPTASAKFTEYFGAGEGPSLKLFYVLSTYETVDSPITDIDGTNYRLNIVDDTFRSLYRNNGNGRQWSPESTSASDPVAPGFFIYTDNKDNLRESSSFRPDDLVSEPAGILVGTFAGSITKNDSDKSAYVIGSSPDMDLTIPNSSFSFTLSTESITPPSGSSFPVDAVPSHLVKLETNESSPRILYLTDYKKNPFVDTLSWTGTNFSDQYLEEDGYFYENIAESYTSPLYLHIWAAVYANGEYFTNIYWSDLEYLGSIPL